MRSSLLLFSLCMTLSLALPAQKAKVAVKKVQADQKFVDNDYWGALNLYRQAAKAQPDNIDITYRIGEVQYYLKHYDIAKTYFERVYNTDPNYSDELPLMMAYTYHRLADLDQALAHYRLYREKVSDKKAEKTDVKALIDQCNYARDMMAAPKSVSIVNLSKEINSRFDDYAPSVTADGKMMVFTSRRPITGVNIVDEAGDHKYFEDIWYSTWDEENDEWMSAERFDQNVNSDTHDAVLSLSPDGAQLFVYKNNTRMAGDIFSSVKNGDAWTIPQKLPRPINSSYFESSVSVTADGSTMYFISERPTGMGRGDIYMATRQGGSDWSKPVNLGEVINTTGDEKFVFIHPNGNTLFFSSNGHLTMGSYDIFRSEYVNGEWSTPVNLGYPINTVNEESTFSMTADNKKLLISAEYADGIGERDIYEIDVSSTDILHSLNIDSDLLTTYRNVSVYGYVMRSDGKPHAFQTVSALDGKTGELIYESKTDRRGYYELPLSRGQVYTVEVVGEDGKKESYKVNLKNLDLQDLSMKQDFDL